MAATITDDERLPVHWIHGTDDFSVRREAKALAERLCPPDEQAFGLEVVDGAVDLVDEAADALQRVRAGLMTRGFFGGRKVVWLRDATFFGDTPAGRSETVREQCARLAEFVNGDWPEGVVLLISSNKADKRTSLYKACDQRGRVRAFDQPEKAYQQEAFAKEQAFDFLRREGVRADARAVDRLLERAGYDTRRLAQEIAKLALYVGDRKDIRPEDIDAIVSPSRESAFWDFAEAAASGNTVETLAVLRRLTFHGTSPVGLLINLGGRVRDLRVLRIALDNGWLRMQGDGRWAKPVWANRPEAEQVLGALGKKDPRKGNPFRVGLLAAQAARHAATEWARWASDILQTQQELVSSAVPQQLQLECLVLKLHQKRATPITSCA